VGVTGPQTVVGERELHSASHPGVCRSCRWRLNVNPSRLTGSSFNSQCCTLNARDRNHKVYEWNEQQHTRRDELE
jgi:hypothetical protein